MRRVYTSNATLAHIAAHRPAGYLDSLGPAIVEQNGAGAWLDLDHPTFRELQERYKDVPVPLMKEQPKPKRKPPLTPEEKKARENRAAAAKREKFNKLWEKLHTATAPDQKLIEVVRSALPCGECKVEFAKWKPDFANWEQSVLDFHNAVSVKLGRAPWTLEQSRQRWKQP